MTVLVVAYLRVLFAADMSDSLLTGPHDRPFSLMFRPHLIFMAPQRSTLSIKSFEGQSLYYIKPALLCH